MSPLLDSSSPTALGSWGAPNHAAMNAAELEELRLELKRQGRWPS